MWYVYFLKSDQRPWYYVGSTNDIQRRVKEHNSGKVTSTKAHTPLRLVYSEAFESEQDARSREQQLKKQRTAKEAIIKQFEN